MCIFPAYAALTVPYSPKIGATGVAYSLLGLTVEIAQNLQVVSTAPTSWPPLMVGITSAVSGLSSSLSGLGGFACIGHADVVTMYACQVLVFPAVIGTLAPLAVCLSVSLRLCRCFSIRFAQLEFDSYAGIIHNMSIEQHSIAHRCDIQKNAGHIRRGDIKIKHIGFSLA